MARRRLNSGVVGAALAVLLFVAFAYLTPGFNMASWWRDTSALLWLSLGLAITGILIGALARAGPGNSMLAVLPAVLLGLVHTIGWDPILHGFDPSSPVAVGALVAVSF